MLGTVAQPGPLRNWPPKARPVAQLASKSKARCATGPVAQLAQNKLLCTPNTVQLLRTQWSKCEFRMITGISAPNEAIPNTVSVGPGGETVESLLQFVYSLRRPLRGAIKQNNPVLIESQILVFLCQLRNGP